MKTLIAALGIAIISSAALAQGAQPLSGPPASGSAQQAPGASGAQPRTVAQCRQDARSQGLKADERKKFMRDCVRDINASCRDQAKSQRLTRDARRDFMATCTGRPPRNAQRRGNDAAPPASNTQAPSGSQAPSNMQAPASSPSGTQAPAQR